MNIGTELKQQRKRHGLTLAEVTQATGISTSFLSDIERGKTRPSIDTLVTLARFYGVSFEIQEPFALANAKPFSELLPDITMPEHMKELMLMVYTHSKRRIETREDWLGVYYTLKGLLE